MEAEAAPMIAEFGLVREPSVCNISKCEMYCGEFSGCKINLITNGKCPVYGCDEVGTVAAAVNTYIAIQSKHPDIIINAGTVGGFGRKGGAIGDVYITTDVRNHDRRIPIPGFEEYARGHYRSVDTPNLISLLGYKSGVLTTSNSLDHHSVDDEIMLENDASVKDMEGAGIAWVAHLANLPFFCVKVVTDIVDGDRPTHEEFLQNLGTAAQSLSDAVPKVVRFVAGKKLADL